MVPWYYWYPGNPGTLVTMVFLVTAGSHSVDNDLDHSERMAMVSDSDSGVGGTDLDHRAPASTFTVSHDSLDNNEEEEEEAQGSTKIR